MSQRLQEDADDAVVRIDPKRLDAAMSRAGIKSDAELGREIGTGRSTINKWRAGTRSPRGALLDKLQTKLRVPARYLFGEEALDDLETLVVMLPPHLREKAAIYIRGLLDAEGPRVPLPSEVEQGRYKDGRPVEPEHLKPAPATPRGARSKRERDPDDDPPSSAPKR